MQLNSSWLVSADYSNSTLTIEFKDGTSFQYQDVPQKIYDDFSHAVSKGKYFRNYIEHAFTSTQL